MTKVLILSVGGSAAPMVNAIKLGRPDYVYFFCSRGPKGSEHTIADPGDPCGDTRKIKCRECGTEQYIGDSKGKAIIVQAGLDPSRYEIVAVDNPDDLAECYHAVAGIWNKITEQYGKDCEVTANYTGGTKTMSVALALAALMRERCSLAVNVGPRADLIKVISGDIPVIIDKWRISSEIQIDMARRAVADYDYAYAYQLFGEILQHPVDASLRAKVLRAAQLCQIFDLWDKFQHAAAGQLMKTCNVPWREYQKALKRILGESSRASGFELVGDLLNNAARRAHRHYYDDAVARIYRATELFAQLRLQQEHGQKSGDIKREALPEGLWEEYKSRLRGSKLVLGLNDVYDLLYKLGDPIGRRYAEQREMMLNALTKRNYSIFAHGIRPLDENDYREVRETLGGFLERTANAIAVKIDVPQLPQEGIV